MTSHSIPRIAVQIISHAVSLKNIEADAVSRFQALRDKLKHMRLRHERRSREQVVFTASHEKRTIRVVLSCAPVEQDAAGDDTLYLKYACPRMDWDYVGRE